MFLKKIQYQLVKMLRTIFDRFKGIEINWGYVFFFLFCSASIILLSSNILRIIQKGYERYEIIQQEKERLEKLVLRNLELKEELKYCSSKEHVDIKAREELNFAFPNQHLVYIDRDTEIDIYSEPQVTEETRLEPDWKLWFDLIFG
jgi:hypothetical protein